RPTRTTDDDSFWAERATALLAPLLHAAAAEGLGIGDVLMWLLRWELGPAANILERRHSDWAANVLLSVAKSADRERSAVFSTASNVLAAYFGDSARAVADPTRTSECAFDPDAFVRSRDTLYITAPAHKQAMCAPIIVALLEAIRHAAYRRSRRVLAGEELGTPDCLFALDECANVAPIHDLGALVSEAGGQGLVVLAVLQDLSQARARWGADTGTGFLSVFGVKVVLPGVADRSTLEAFSTALGDHAEWVPSISEAATAEGPVAHRGGTWTYRPNYSPGEIAGLRAGHALHVSGAEGTVVKLVPWHLTPVGRHTGGGSRSPATRAPEIRVTSRVRRRSS
ncbi:MAG TPA: TraM recognition domain-containing protein, partial [Marisediminicola sp.]|nr:TraM recognition domain-containing protein [Marisediminicola sp.]